MAHKTRKQIEKKVKELRRLKIAIAVRHPDFKKDYKEYIAEDKKIKEEDVFSGKFLAQVKKFKDKYGIIPFDPKEFKNRLSANIYGDVCQVKFKAPMDLASIFEKISALPFPRGYLNLCLEDYKWLNLKIDIDADLELLKQAVIREISYFQKLKRKAGLPKSKERKVHLKNAERYFKVFDYRNRKPPLEYEKIALKMLRDYRGKNKELKTIMDNCKKDYAVAFEAIFGIPYKDFDKKMIDESKLTLCNTCNKRKVCRELCADMAALLSSIEVKCKEKLFDKDVTDITPPKFIRRNKKKTHQDY